VDESGDSSLKNIGKDYPVLSLAFCIFNKREYSRKIVPAFLDFKLHYWGHGAIVLHEAEVRKNWSEKYGTLVDTVVYETFLADLEALIDQATFHVIASVIHKLRLRSKYFDPIDPYELAVLFSMERLLNWLVVKGESGKTVHVIFENRSIREDDELRLAFNRIASNFSEIKFIPLFIAKAANETGLQVADLVARPIGLGVIRPHQPNRTHAIIRRKFISDGPEVFPREEDPSH
ncbi:MAG: DUF3800 domain-containing protein, partial [Proteobacteria bacterium]|nr:DUF3800 domain-containing protein [Pseudomonadota bacterium]